MKDVVLLSLVCRFSVRVSTAVVETEMVTENPGVREG